MEKREIGIKVIGVGGSGLAVINALNRLPLKQVEFVAIDRDLQALTHCHADVKIHLSADLADIDLSSVTEAIRGANLVFIATGLGGETGTVWSPSVARIAKSCGSQTVGLISTPIFYEGRSRTENAKSGFRFLSRELDSYIVIPSHKVITTDNFLGSSNLAQAFETVNDVAKKACSAIVDHVESPGYIDLEFNDLAVVLRHGLTRIGWGQSRGSQRAISSAKQAVSHPLLMSEISLAKQVFVTVSGSSTLGLHETLSAIEFIGALLDQEANFMFGNVIDESLGNQMLITVVASDFRVNDNPFTSPEDDLFVDNSYFWDQDQNGGATPPLSMLGAKLIPKGPPPKIESAKIHPLECSCGCNDFY